MTSVVLRKCIQAIYTSNLITFLVKIGLNRLINKSMQEHRLKYTEGGRMAGPRGPLLFRILRSEGKLD